jgi:hypothetical protein
LRLSGAATLWFSGELGLFIELPSLGSEHDLPLARNTIPHLPAPAVAPGAADHSSSSRRRLASLRRLPRSRWKRLLESLERPSSLRRARAVAAPRLLGARAAPSRGARGVILVEGAAERYFVPSAAKDNDIDLDTWGTTRDYVARDVAGDIVALLESGALIEERGTDGSLGEETVRR